MVASAGKFVTLLLPLAALAFGKRTLPPRPSVPPAMAPEEAAVVDKNGSTIPPYTTTYYFDQLIDHTKPELGTFKQRFWHTWEFYEAGGPIILSTPGESNAEGYSGYLTNRTINGQLAQQENGATIVIEHRFYGLSNPYPSLDDDSLQLNTIQQAIDDLEYFAKNVKLAMPGGDNVKPDQAKWVLMGGSYSGALTSWTMVNKPGLFHSGYSSSGVVEAIVDYWGYFEPIRQNMPKNCSADVEAVINYVDATFTGSNETAINEIKAIFGLEALTHLDDVAGALRNNLWDWQSLQPNSGAGTTFTRFCDALEVKEGVSAGPEGQGLEHALQAWGNFWTKGGYLAELCEGSDIVECLGSYDPTSKYYTDTSIDNAGRSWYWMVCNEVGFLQDGAPSDHPTLVSRLVQPEYDQRQCSLMFPKAFPKPTVPKADEVNKKYLGWDVKIDHLFFANGRRDPWKEATMSADGLDVQSTDSQPIALSDGFHCSDLSTATGNADATIKAVQQQALRAIGGWLAEDATPKRRSIMDISLEMFKGVKVSRSVGSLGA